MTRSLRHSQEKNSKGLVTSSRGKINSKLTNTTSKQAKEEETKLSREARLSLKSKAGLVDAGTIDSHPSPEKVLPGHIVFWWHARL